MAAFVPVWSVISTAQEVANGYSAGRRRGADMYCPVSVFFVGDPKAASQMGKVFGKAGLRKCVLWRRGVNGVIV